MEYYTLQSGAIQAAYADLNADVTSAAISCPVLSCPFNPIIYASAFAAGSFSGASTSTNGTSPYVSTYPTDSYTYMGQATVQNERTPFPPWTSPPPGPTDGVQNMNVRFLLLTWLHGQRPGYISRALVVAYDAI